MQHQPPDSWLDDLARASLIFVSHNHSDHLNEHTLRKLVARNPSVKFIVPDFESHSVERPLKAIGFTDILPIPFQQWFQLNDEMRVMILPDSAGRDDSGLLVDYKGHLLLNNVDCANLNGGDVPRDVDVYMSAFTSGASGFPVCWKEMYGDERIKDIISRNKRLVLKGVTDCVKAVNAKVVVPFAGYFKEAFPDDREIAELNFKNTPQDVARSVAIVLPDAVTWMPTAGGVFDVGLRQETRVGTTDRSIESYSFSKYERFFDECIPATEDEGLAFLIEYYRISGFRGDLVLHIVETDNQFVPTGREHMVDFLTMKMVEVRPLREHRYSRLKVRSRAFWHTVKNGLPWEEISIGFQARFYREPDVYEFDFWTHFQNKIDLSLKTDWKVV